MAIRKTYQSIHFTSLSTYVSVNGQKVLIQFQGGALRPRRNGIYTTDDPAIIAALDARAGKSFRCIHVEGKPTQENKPETSKEEKKEANKSESSPEGLKEVPEVTNVVEARNYLIANVEGITSAKLPNMQSVINAASKNGISFPNLQ